MHSKENAAEDAKKALFEQSLIRVEKEPCPKCKKGVLPRELQWHLKKDCSHRLKVRVLAFAALFELVEDVLRRVRTHLRVFV